MQHLHRMAVESVDGQKEKITLSYEGFVKELGELNRKNVQSKVTTAEAKKFKKTVPNEILQLQNELLLLMKKETTKQDFKAVNKEIENAFKSFISTLRLLKNDEREIVCNQFNTFFETASEKMKKLREAIISVQHGYIASQINSKEAKKNEMPKVSVVKTPGTTYQHKSKRDVSDQEQQNHHRRPGRYN